jgi:hypothetical protein
VILDELLEPARRKARAILAKMPGFTVGDVNEQPVEGGRSWVLHMADQASEPAGALIVFVSDAELKGKP